MYRNIGLASQIFSSGASLVESLNDILRRKVYDGENLYDSVEWAARYVSEEWNKIELDLLTILIKSIQNSCIEFL